MVMGVPPSRSRTISYNSSFLLISPVSDARVRGIARIMAEEGYLCMAAVYTNCSMNTKNQKMTRTRQEVRWRRGRGFSAAFDDKARDVISSFTRYA